ISLLLTLGLWSTSPGGEQVYDSAAVREVNVGGVTVKNRDIIRPSDVIFHIDQKVYGFESPKKRNSFFKDTNQWEIDPIDTNQVENTSSNKDHVEVIFPTSVPFEFLPGLYTLDENFVTPN